MQRLAQRTFPAALNSVREAREFTTKALTSWGGCSRLDDIRLCVSELAANAATHGSPDGQNYQVRVVRHACCVHVEVHDTASRSEVRVCRDSTMAEEGRGMRIVQDLCDDWGVTTESSKGKVVWTCFRPPTAVFAHCPSTP